MRILQLTQSLGNGGAEKFLVELSNALSEKHDIHIASIHPVDEWMLPPKMLNNRIPVLSLQIKKKYSLKCFWKLIALIRKVKPDIIHVHSSMLMVYFVIIFPFVPKKTLVHTIHATLTPAYNKLFRLLNIPVFRQKKFVHVCISGFIYHTFNHTFKKLPFRLIENGIYPMHTSHDLQKTRNKITGYKKNTESTVFMAIGNYTHFKNFTALAHVFKELYEKGQNVMLVILGEDCSPEQRAYHEILHHKAPNTFLEGFRSNTADYLTCCDALVIPSLQEGMPLVAIEAFSRNIPVICTPAGGLVDMVKNDYNGIITQDFDNRSLYNAIQKYLQLTDQEWQQMRKNAGKDYEAKYAMDICAAKYENLYQAIMGKHYAI